MYQIEITVAPSTWQTYSISERVRQLIDPDGNSVADYHGVAVRGSDIATIFSFFWNDNNHKVAERVPDTAIMRAVWGDVGNYQAITIMRFSYKKTLSKESHSTPDDFINYYEVPDETPDKE